MKPAALLAATVLVTGCVHTVELPPAQAEHEAVVVSAPPPEAAPAPDPARARPRLSQTVTLGQSTESYGEMPGAPAAAGQGGVVVNNNIYVMGGQPPIYGAYGYGYGAGYGYGGYGGGGRGSRTTPGWTASGWEGAQRTAGPGRTPGVGGNWSPAPSYGPRPMR